MSQVKSSKNLFIYTVVVVVALAYFFLPDSAQDNVISSKEKSVNIQEWFTGNGARVLYVNAPGLPMVDIQTIFDAGSARDGDYPGLASLVSGLLSHGAKKGDEVLGIDEISEQIDSVGARFGSGSSRDSAEISLRSLTDEKWLSTALNIMQAVIKAPTFDNKELERVRKQLMVGFEGRKQSMATIVSELFYKNLYSDHPYALPGIGTEESVKKISRKNIVDFYKKYYVAKNALVIIVGDVDKNKAKEMAEKVVGQLPSGEKAQALIAVKELTKEVIIHKEYPSSQTHVMIGQPGVHRKDKDYFTLYVGNHILGGSGFGSRITEEIREKRGLAYSSYSYFIPLSKRGPFLIGMQTSNEKAEEALKILRKTLVTFIDEGPTEKELAHAKKNITGGFPLNIDSNSDISNYIAMIGFHNLPLTYLRDFNKRVEAVTLEQIKEAFKRRVNPDKMVTITVGTKVKPEKESEKNSEK